MEREFEYYEEKADELVAQDKGKVEAIKAYEAMFHCDWDFPDHFEGVDWLRKVVSTDPHDAISAGNRVLSGLDPLIKIRPLADNQETKTEANDWEKVLMWQMKALNRRRQGGVVSDVTFSSLMYDEICAQVLDLDYQIEQMKMLGAHTKRLEAARRFGRFVVNVYNPKNVHVRYSGLMPECVLLRVKKSGYDILAEWGEVGKQLEGHEKEQFLYFDLMDYETRVVWATPLEGGSALEIVKPTENKLPFMNWVVMIGSATFEDKEENKRQPVLYSVYRSGNWHTQNVVKSLYTSEVISHAAAPRVVEEGTNPDRAEIDYGDPARGAKAPPGNTLKPFAPPPIDAALLQVDQQLQASTNKSTVASVLQNADIPPGTAFATLNLATQTAVGALKPAKRLAEVALAEILTTMLLWVKESEVPLLGMGLKSRGEEEGKQYVIMPDEIEPEALYIDVELKPDIPTDRQQRINAAAMAVQSLNYPREYALEDIGVADPQAAEEARFMEIMSDSLIQQQIQSMAAQNQFQLQMMFQAMQAQLQNAKPPTPEEVQGGSVEGGPPQDTGFNPGDADNPDDGGTPFALNDPEATFEGKTGQTRRGENTGVF